MLCFVFNSNKYRKKEYDEVAAKIQKTFIDSQNKLESYSLELSIKQGNFTLSDFTRHTQEGYNTLYIENDTIKYWSNRIYFPENILEIAKEEGDKIISVENKKYYIKKEKLTPEESLIFVLPFSNANGEIYFPITNADSFTVNEADGSDQKYELNSISSIVLSKFYLKSDLSKSNPIELHIVWWLGIFFLIYGVFIFFKTGRHNYFGINRVFVLIMVYALIKLLIYFDPFQNLQEFDFFKPYLYANKVFGNSIGLLLINISLVFLVLNVWYSSTSPFEKRISNVNRILKIVISSVYISLAYSYFLNLFKSIIVDSTPDIIFFETSSFAQFTLFGIIIICGMILFFFLVRIVRIFIVQESRLLSKFILGLLTSGLSFIILSLTFTPLNSIIFSVFIGVFVGILIMILNDKNKIINFSQTLICIIFCSLISNYAFSTFNTFKKKQNIKSIAVKISIEQDHFSFLQINQLPNKIRRDTTIINELKNSNPSNKKISNIIYTKYLVGDIDNYKLNITHEDIDSIYQDDYTLESKVGNYDKFEYLINIPYINENDNQNKLLKINLYELKLLSDYSFYKRYQNIKNEQQLPRFPIFNELSYSVVYNNELVFSKGESKGNFLDDIPNLKVGELTVLSKNKYCYKYGEKGLIFLYMPNPNITNLEIVRFSYVFSSIILSYIFLVLIKSKFRLKNLNFFNTSLANRVQFISLSTLYISAVIIILISVQFIKKSSDRLEVNKYKNFITLVHDSYKNSILQKNVDDHNEEFYKYINDNFNNLTNDLNFYSKDGFLIFAKESVLYDDKVWPKIIDPIAWEQIISNTTQIVVIDEQLFDVKYSGLYAAIRDENYNLEGILYVPTFDAPYFSFQGYSLFNNSLISIFALALFGLTLFSYIATRSFIKVLSKIRERISIVDFGSNEKLIDWKFEDEIGLLINEYNNMVEKLDENAVLLARNERESAWRDMAKQIAHEIKNPLTPMKLSIQHLKFKLKQEDESQSSKYITTLDTLVEQIGHLSEIADDFSDIAKMDVPELEIIDLKSIVVSMKEIFSNKDKFSFEVDDTIATQCAFVKADSTMINSVFTNIIKNSIQALTENRKGILKITILEIENQYEIRFFDNGRGIKQSDRAKIFTPNFSTKTSGTGIGLMMVKKIIDLHHGNISFSSIEDESTEFTIILEKYKFFE